MMIDKKNIDITQTIPDTLPNIYTRKLFIYLIYKVDDLKKTSLSIEHFSVSVIQFGFFAEHRDSYGTLKKH